MADAKFLAQIAQLLKGGNTFGGQKHGGNTFGGQTFGGAQYGASAPTIVQNAAAPPPVGPTDFVRPVQPDQPTPVMAQPAPGNSSDFQTATGPLPRGDLVDAQTQRNTTLPPMPAPQQIGMPSARPDVLAAWQQLMQARQANLPPQMANGQYSDQV